MIYSCYYCNSTLKFKNDDEAISNGVKILGYNMAENSRYIKCKDCSAPPEEKKIKKNKYEKMIEVIK